MVHGAPDQIILKRKLKEGGQLKLEMPLFKKSGNLVTVFFFQK